MNQVKRAKHGEPEAQPAAPAEPADVEKEQFKGSAIHKARWDFVAC